MKNEKEHLYDLKVRHKECEALQKSLLGKRSLIIAANRGPVTFYTNEFGRLAYQRGGGGLVTALTGLAQHVNACWIGCALSEEDRKWEGDRVYLEDGEQGDSIEIIFLCPDDDSYDGYYNVISNPLLWFLHHSMWDWVRSPTINHATWRAWNEGYVTVNRLFAQSISEQIEKSDKPSLVMLQDYHLYLAPRMIRDDFAPSKPYTLTHFVHIPWPGQEDWGILPPKMRQAILESLCAVDLLGFQTHDDGLNFLRTVETHLKGSRVFYKRGMVKFNGHHTFVRDFPISIDVEALLHFSDSEEVSSYAQQLKSRFGNRQFVVRVDRTEPSKNIVRGFQAFDELLELHPEHLGRVQFLAFLVPSRMEVEEYQSYLDELMAAAGRVNARHGDGDWEPVRILVGENYARAVAALQLYDVLLVNSVADGMNLVAKEGPTVNQRDGTVILSNRTGARQQLEPGALIISPADIFETAEALHQALSMPSDERRLRAGRLRQIVETSDIVDWLCRQLETIRDLKL